MIKKTLICTTLGMFAFAAYANTTNIAPKSTLVYSTSTEKVLQSKNSLVQVEAYTTTTDLSHVKTRLMSFLYQSFNTVQWRVIDIQSTTLKSGALNVALVTNARLTDAELAHLYKRVNENKNNNASYKIKILSHAPELRVIEAAKKEAYLTIFQNTQNYLTHFNKTTNSHYHIQKIQFNAYQERANYLVGLTRYQASPKKPENHLDNATKIKIDATITLATSK